MPPPLAKVTPKISVVMATYNMSEVLPYSIGSVLAQSFADFELIVVGDGCTDDSEEVVEAIGDPRLRWINLPANSGHQSAPNNAGIAAARGELIAYLGHDDLWLPHHLESMVEAIEAGADMAYGITSRIPPDGDPDDVPACRLTWPGAWVPPSSVVHKRSLIDLVGDWRDYRILTVNPESDLWTRFHAAGALIHFVPRLSTIKFPASKRRDVYRERPSHEQSAWLARIRDEKQFEAAELARLLAASVERSRDKPYGELLAEFFRRTAAGIGRRFSGTKPGATIEGFRRLKGLDPALERDRGGGEALKVKDAR
jgi:glycosyltransferase involved in cell wall biosynthesis